MANQITDNRTILFDADSVTGDNGGRWDTLGSTSETLDTDVKIEGTGSIGEQMTNGVRTLIWDNGSTFDISNQHLYIWVNCGVVGLLDLKSNGGFRIRFTGPSSANFFEYYVGGSDSWPTAIEGGWVQFVVDLAATASNTGGTPPAKTAVQGVGIAALTTTMTKVSDNTWVDAAWTLAPNTPGIIIEGRNGGSTDWDSADILTQLTTSSGMFVASAGGSYKLNAPIQFGINDTTTHGFADTNKVWLWDDQEFVASDHYGLSALGNSGGTTSVQLGLKTGTGDDATGSQGLTIAASSSGVRWFLDFDDPNLDTINFHGCAFQHGATFDLDDAAVSCISTLYIDCEKANVANSEQLRVSAINAATADGTAFMVTDDIADIVFSTFEFSDGHAIELNAATPTAQTNKGNLFSGYTNTINSTDAAILNSAAGDLVISNTNASNLNVNSYRNTGGGTVSIVNSVTVEFTIVDESGDPIEGAKVFLEETPGGTDVISYALTNASGVVSTTFAGSTPQAVTGYVRKGTVSPVYKAVPINATISSTGLFATVTMVLDE